MTPTQSDSPHVANAPSQVSACERAWRTATANHPRPIKSAALTLALVALVLGVIAAGFDPAGSRGSPSAPRPIAIPQPHLFDPHGRPLLGELIGRDAIVRIYDSPDGPRYTICDLSGDVMAEGLTPSEVAERFPQIDLHRLILEPAPEMHGPIMSAEPHAHFSPNE